MASPLSKLTKKADSVVERSAVLLRKCLREVQYGLEHLSPGLNVAGSAADRERVFELIRRRFRRLSRLLDAQFVDVNTFAARAAADAASEMSGLDVKYSARRAEAICELVTPAQGENIAAVFTDKMAANLISALREATVATLRDTAVTGGSLKEISKDLLTRWKHTAEVENPVFRDVSGRAWDTGRYLQMNVRTNAMRVYNDCLVDDIAQSVGTDLVRVSKGGDPDCGVCSVFEGQILSISGKTKEFPSYEEARAAGCFHPNCTHTLEYVDEDADADEISRQMKHPFKHGAEDPAAAQDERKYEIDQARYRDAGLSKEAARVAVDRDNLADAIRFGLVRADAADLVAKLTDAQVTALCHDGNPPRFEPVKRIPGGTKASHKYEKERFIHSKKGGVVHIDRKTDLENLLAITGAEAK